MLMAETPVHVAPAVAAVRALWDRSGEFAGPGIPAQLSAFADAVTAAYAAGERAAEVLVENWLDAPRWRSQDQGKENERPSTRSLSLRHARQIVARDHGFASWSGVAGECDPVSLGVTNIRTFVDPQNPTRVALLMDVADSGCGHGCDGQ